MNTPASLFYGNKYCLHHSPVIGKYILPCGNVIRCLCINTGIIDHVDDKHLVMVADCSGTNGTQILLQSWLHTRHLRHDISWYDSRYLHHNDFVSIPCVTLVDVTFFQALNDFCKFHFSSSFKSLRYSVWYFLFFSFNSGCSNQYLR